MVSIWHKIASVLRVWYITHVCMVATPEPIQKGRVALLSPLVLGSLTEKNQETKLVLRGCSWCGYTSWPSSWHSWSWHWVLLGLVLEVRMAAANMTSWHRWLDSCSNKWPQGSRRTKPCGSAWRPMRPDSGSSGPSCGKLKLKLLNFKRKLLGALLMEELVQLKSYEPYKVFPMRWQRCQNRKPCLDVKGFGKPQTPGNDAEAKFRLWSVKWRTIVCRVCGGKSREVLEWRSLAWRWATTMGRMQTSWVNGRMRMTSMHSSIAFWGQQGFHLMWWRAPPTGSGLEAWRCLRRRFDPATGSSHASGADHSWRDLAMGTCRWP